jgi:two-component system OmpR family response regulator
MRILVVEDDLDFGDTVAEHLDRLGHEVRVASNAPQALALVDTFRPDVVFIDIGLPIFDGNSVAAAVREHSTPPPTLVALTAVIHSADVSLFDACIAKPTTVAEVERLLSSTLLRFGPPGPAGWFDDVEDTHQ